MATAIGDPDSTRTVLAIIALLVVLGIALVMLAFWLRRQTRPDPELLAPLELMGRRSWRRGDPVWQRRRLDDVRPPQAVPLTRASAPPHFDESFDDGPTGAGFDDLHHDAPSTDGDDDPEPAHTTEVDRGELATDDIDAETDDTDADVGADGVERATDNGASTPIAAARPLDDFSDSDIDPEEVERAMAELDAELGQRE